MRDRRDLRGRGKRWDAEHRGWRDRSGGDQRVRSR